jgi:polyhydroxybutyrate depolymerase
MRRGVLALLCGSVVLAGAAHAATLEAAALQRPEGPRHVLLARPTVERPGLRPLVVVLHGHGGSAAQVLGRTRGASPLSLWLELVDREGLLVAAPDGSRGSDGMQGWNDCRRDAHGNPRSDDVGLVAAIIDRAIAVHRADPARVFVIGMSNGGMMAFRVATELGPRLAAFAAVGAAMAADSWCPAPKHPVPALVVAGTADPFVPYAGGPVGLGGRGARGTVVGAEASVAAWRALAGLPDAPARHETLPHRDARDPTRTTRILWGADPAGLQLEFVRIDGGGHVEPSGRARIGRLYARLVGPQSGDLEIVDEAWAFFRDKRARP